MPLGSIRVPRVRGRGYANIEREATIFLQKVAPDHLATPGALPVVPIFDLEIFEHYHFKSDPTDLAPGVEGLTSIDDRTVQVAHAVYLDAEQGDGRARFTFAHELGHVVLHGDVASARFTEGANIAFARRTDLRPFEDPEWQADVFAASILMPWPALKVLRDQYGVVTRRLLMDVFQVSSTAAARRAGEFQRRQSASGSTRLPCADGGGRR